MTTSPRLKAKEASTSTDPLETVPKEQGDADGHEDGRGGAGDALVQSRGMRLSPVGRVVRETVAGVP